MTIEIKRNAEKITIALGGRLDTTTAPALDKTKTLFLISRNWNTYPAQVFAFFSELRRR